MNDVIVIDREKIANMDLSTNRESIEPRLRLSPQGRLYFDGLSAKKSAGATSAKGSLATKTKALSATTEQLQVGFGNSSGDGLLTLASVDVPDSFSAEFKFWKQFACKQLQDICQLDEKQRQKFDKKPANSRKPTPASVEKLLPPPDELELAVLVSAAPPMQGLEYLTPEVLRRLWVELAIAIQSQASESGGLVKLLAEIAPQFQLLGRVTLHLAENRKNEEKPFAFMATFAHRMSARSTVKHLPLAEALRNYAGEKDQAKLAELLTPIRLAADGCPLIRNWLESRAIFQPQALTIREAHQFLHDVPAMEQAGLVVRVPNWWRARSSSQPSVQIRLGEKQPAGLGADSLLDFSMDISLGGEPLTADEQEALLRADDGLMLLRGKWVEVDQQRLQDALKHWQQLESEHSRGVDFLRGMRMLAGASLDGADDEEQAADWVRVVAGDWLQETLANLRDPAGVVGCRPGKGLQATLRPYQEDGVRWLWFMTRLRLGACLADDMGLGKTIQVIDLLLRLKDKVGDEDKVGASDVNGLDVQVVDEAANPSRSKKNDGLVASSTTSNPHLLIVPASLLGNWKQELARFAPQLRTRFVHRSECDAKTIERIGKSPKKELADFDLVATTYTMARKADWLGDMQWQLVILDEAQAIKNASSKQTRAIKRIPAACRIVLTGTPVENQLGDLWSLFDFFNPGLLGNARQFRDLIRRLGRQDDVRAYGALRRLVQPYILRRMKTDPDIVTDLPDKTEMRVACGLTKKQAAFYNKAVKELAAELKTVNTGEKDGGIRRRGVVLSTMMGLKQICNHPSQYLGEADFPATESDKFSQLAAVCEQVAERQEKVLVFTQFQKMCEPLTGFLATVFGRQGLTLHGGVPVKRRKELVKQFQEDETVPYFVISVKAGGTGLNLTAASHVIHFDRWWNPAVENQATDRAYRIGQQRNVLVHKFVCRGTLEEKIDEILRSKQEMTDQILGKKQEGEVLLTELSDKELLNLITLDVTTCSV